MRFVLRSVRDDVSAPDAAKLATLGFTLADANWSHIGVNYFKVMDDAEWTGETLEDLKELEDFVGYDLIISFRDAEIRIYNGHES